ncbi:MAG: hypothetical protein RLZZ202_787, partial [Pseudomonadota bacterium]
IQVGSVKIDIQKMLARKDEIVNKMTGGISFLFRKNKVTSIKGHASFAGKNAQGYQIKITGKDAGTIAAKKLRTSLLRLAQRQDISLTSQ